MTLKRAAILLGPGTDWQLNACINYGDGWHIYAAGYREAAERLTSSVYESRSGQDSLIYPVLFLWRHHVELQVKIIARGCSRILGRPWSPPAQHDVAQLFGEARRLLEETFAIMGEKIPRGEFDHLRTILGDLRQVDAQSFAFRYPEALSGGSVLKGEQYVNYENVRAYFTELADLLDSAVTAVGVFNDWHQDMLSAY